MKQSVNAEKIQELYDLDGDGEVLKELINLFVPGTENKLSKLQMLNPVNAADVKPIAHEMRSSCANLGAEILSDLATQLEYLPVDGSYQQNASDIIFRMADEFKRIKPILEKHL